MANSIGRIPGNRLLLPKLRSEELAHNVTISLMADIDETPTVDAVPVVRCRECVKREFCRTSNTWAVAPSDDWFCADGERKGGADDADS